MSVPGSTSGGASFECSLAGTVLPGQFQHLYDRLLGLCEHAAHSKMFEHEMLFTPATPRPIYAPRNDDVHLRLRVKLTVQGQPTRNLNGANIIANGTDRKRQKSDSHGDNSAKDRSSESSNNNNQQQSIPAEDTEMTSGTQETDNQAQLTAETITAAAAAATTATVSSTVLQATDATSGTLSHSPQGSKTIVTRQYQLCQYGHPEPGRTIVVRSAILVKIHGDAFGFLSLLGYGYEDEFVRRGYSFLFNNICRISVFRKYKLSKQHDPFSAIVPEQEAIGGHSAEISSPWVVEIASSFVSQENVNGMSEEINVVRNLLAGSVAF
ncbi:hypothetical protein EDD11_001049 [Mortierella claussenii]|nr:hypothetical protein EDD11_001049 [Mortierella claussenii]